MSDERAEVETGASRRAVFLGAGAVGATAFLAACGTEEPTGGATAPPATSGSSGPASPTPSAAGEDDDDNEDSGEDESAEAVLVSADEVEVGGGVILGEESVVVTQPAAGNFRGFSAVCTHQGCTVSSISNGIINCQCHGSQYSIEDGSVIQGAVPGQGPLPEVAINVDGDRITRA
jgi:Rieske Fe-S protein